MRRVFLLGILLCFVTGCNFQSSSVMEEKEFNYQTISSSEVFHEIENNSSKFHIIDVRTSVEYESGHILTAINIPLESIDSIDFNKEDQIVVYCQSGARSKKAFYQLFELGYQNVFDLCGIEDIPSEMIQ